MRKLNCTNKDKFSKSGFTIVELLIVIVIIGILAAITIVSYSGITSRAVVSSLQSDLKNTVTQLKLDQVINGGFPTNLAAANGGKGAIASSGTTLSYAVSNTTNPQTFCVTATKNNVSYNITQDGNLLPGICPVLNLDAGNILSYSGAGTTWTDLSGNGNNGVLNGGVAYNPSNSGVMSFDGVDDYVNIPASTNLNNAAFTVEAWVNPSVARVQGVAHKLGANGWRLFMSNATGYIEFDAQPGEIANVQALAIPTASWTHIVASYDGTSSAKIYTNGILRSTVSGIATMFGDSNYRVEIASSEVNRWNGTIGKVNIYNHNLSDIEILQKFNKTKGRYGI